VSQRVAAEQANEPPAAARANPSPPAQRPAGSQFFYDTAGSRDKTLKLYEGHAHDLLDDLDREKVMGDIIGWIDARLPAA
jgi:alpha-beta hydrolase superfamily lysophospholipase